MQKKLNLSRTELPTSQKTLSIRCKMDGSKYYNRIQSGLFQHWSMAATLHVQFNPGWMTSILNCFGIQSTVFDKYTNSRKRKHDRDNAHKINLKYKKQQLMTHYSQQTVKSLPMTVTQQSQMYLRLN